ncbi:hypothetical protein ACFL20_09625 [Spirochaetota bacterium]
MKKLLILSLFFSSSIILLFACNGDNESYKGCCTSVIYDDDLEMNLTSKIYSSYPDESNLEFPRDNCFNDLNGTWEENTTCSVESGTRGCKYQALSYKTIIWYLYDPILFSDNLISQICTEMDYTFVKSK